MDQGDISGTLTLAAAGLLILAGAPKLRRPLPLVRAARSVGLPVTAGVARGFAAVEVTTGVLAIVVPTRPVQLLVGLLYLGFTGFVLLARARGGVLESCGCFGEPDTPPTLPHAVITGLLASGAITAAALSWTWSAALPDNLAIAAGALLVGFLCWLVIAVLPTITVESVRSIRTAPASSTVTAKG